nr:transglutaminase family protein [uncultured Caproiciproducens sp.]
MNTDNHSAENNQPNIPGIQISPPLLTGHTASPAANAVFRMILILSGVFGAAWCFISAFALPVLPFTIISYTLLFVGVFALIYSLKRFQYLIFLIACLFYIAAAWYLRNSIFQGFIITVNRMMVAYSKHSDYEFPIYLVSALSSQYAHLCTLFVLFVLFIVTVLVSRAVMKNKSFWLAFFATAPLLLAALAFTITPNFLAVLMLFLCWTILILTRLSAEKKKGFIKIHKAFMTKSDSVSAKSGLLMIPAVLLCFVLIMAIFPRQSYQRPKEAENLRTNLIDSVTGGIFLNGGKAFAGNVNHVDLAGAGRVEFTGKTALQIKSDKKYPLYLKSFAGSVYTGSSWEQLADSDYTGINQKLKGLNVQNMSHAFVLLANRQNDPTLNPFGIQVKNIAAAKQCIYAPYNLATTPENITGVKFVNDAFIRSGFLFGTGRYSLYAYALSQDKISSDPAGVVLSLTKNSLFDSKSGTAYLQAQNQFSTLYSSNLAAYYKSTLPDDLLDVLDGQTKTFIKAEQDYRLFMYDKYTQLPRNTRKKILSLIKQDKQLNGFFTKDMTSSYSYSSVNDIANAVKKYLGSNCYYTLSPAKVPTGDDFVNFFVTESHQGYCVHFATAAAVMLRAMGVPARYAEGYIVTADDYLTAGIDGWANIRDSRAHAWVELYYPGLGWQPFDVTPGFNPARNLTQDNNPVNQPPASSTEVSSAPAESTAQSEPGNASSLPESTGSLPTGNSSTGGETEGSPDFNIAAAPLVLIIAFVVLLLACMAIKRRIVLRHRAKLFSLTDANKAAIEIYAYLTALEKYGGEISAGIKGIALKARFSQHSITEEERIMMADFAHQTAFTCYDRLPKVKRLVFKYIDNLI